MAHWVVVATCKFVSRVVTACTLECVEGSTSLWVVVENCKLELAVVETCKVVRDDKVLVKGGMTPLVVGEMCIDN